MPEKGTQNPMVFLNTFLSQKKVKSSLTALTVSVLFALTPGTSRATDHALALRHYEAVRNTVTERREIVSPSGMPTLRIPRPNKKARDQLAASRQKRGAAVEITGKKSTPAVNPAQ